MKILIAYDGSESVDAALSDLPRAGLHGDVEAPVYVADLWLPSSRIEFARAAEGDGDKSDPRGTALIVASVAGSTPCSVEVARKGVLRATAGAFLPPARVVGGSRSAAAG